jgi:hypothetical protein
MQEGDERSNAAHKAKVESGKKEKRFEKKKK